MKNDQEKGKRKIQIIFGAYIIFEIILMFMTFISFGPTRGFTVVVRLGLTLGLFYCVLKKKNWARILTVLLFLFGGISGLLRGIRGPYILVIVLGIGFIIAGVTIFGSKDVEEYMRM